MTRATAVRAVLAAAVLLVSVYITLTMSPRLGLDLQGGTRMVLQAKDSDTATADRDSTDRTLEVLRQRVDSLGVAEPTLTRSGEDRIIVELPDVQDPRQAAEVLGKTAQLSFHPVQGPGTEPAADDKEKDEGEGSKAGPTLPDEQGDLLALGPVRLSGAGVKDATASFDAQQGTGWSVSLDFHKDAGKKWTGLTGEAACNPVQDERRRVAIVLDGKVISSPQVSPSVGCNVGLPSGSTQITGSFGADEARDLALLIKGGSLPVPVEIVEQRIVGPTLGAAAIDASARAALIGAAATALFITVMYRLFGALAALALAAYGVISYAALVVLGVTLTLPGLAGFVLAIGMAVDANVLVFERAREECADRPNRTLLSALTAGFRGAWSAVADSNVTTLIAAGLLFFLGSGPVKGFGVTLAIGVIASMFSALVIARALTEIAAGSRFVSGYRGVNGIARPGAVRTRLNARDPQLFRSPRRWLAFSAVLVAVAVAGIVVRGVNLGVEFTGGRLVEYSTSRPVDVEKARDALSTAGFGDAEVTTAGDGDLSVRTGKLDDDGERAVRAALAEEGGEATKIRDELIGPSLGDELRRNALIALGVAVFVQLAYLAARFRWTFAVASVGALVHDVIILVGAFAWLGRTVDGIFLAALLTVIGYSVNDSVVVFDRVRELWAKSRRTPLPDIANRAVLQTVPRTVNTGMGALFILAALAVLGGDSLADFALALLIGICVGTYSSVMTAVPGALLLETSSKAPPPARKRAPGRKVSRQQRRDPLDNGARV
ncbi:MULTISPECIES: protein translocase subunit SecD [unclassified Streptomyces]|uniref:protein translocase subunit SecD n=1 Tax=unclassified Streptomyces TaxID=2593676 RepID=UPI0001C1A7FF|nr:MULTISPECIES: protein translocase subunit SecD [unclassified Streptomyces]AEN13512.1 protein-export membrane protein SecD [Streptomyces sp. SirexAA-E]MYR65104.1 protein translocase subunit SecD [Streptomyces sp. SID4939]MYS03706.1 protein translocase subunit SecD [Streptomyces sp. SID4940]MYT67040.1 protein translocase subunit SecD [Streptomyces sp. SID8357]MYT84684.1 protein translocase subunit SecD [Streptomyces sp. SID8360]